MEGDGLGLAVVLHGEGAVLAHRVEHTHPEVLGGGAHGKDILAVVLDDHVVPAAALAHIVLVDIQHQGEGAGGQKVPNAVDLGLTHAGVVPAGGQVEHGPAVAVIHQGGVAGEGQDAVGLLQIAGVVRLGGLGQRLGVGALHGGLHGQHVAIAVKADLLHAGLPVIAQAGGVGVQGGVEAVVGQIHPAVVVQQGGLVGGAQHAAGLILVHEQILVLHRAQGAGGHAVLHAVVGAAGVVLGPEEVVQIPHLLHGDGLPESGQAAAVGLPEVLQGAGHHAHHVLAQLHHGGVAVAEVQVGGAVVIGEHRGVNGLAHGDAGGAAHVHGDERLAGGGVGSGGVVGHCHADGGLAIGLLGAVVEVVLAVLLLNGGGPGAAIGPLAHGHLVVVDGVGLGLGGVGVGLQNHALTLPGSGQRVGGEGVELGAAPAAVAVGGGEDPVLVPELVNVGVGKLAGQHRVGHQLRGLDGDGLGAVVVGEGGLHVLGQVQGVPVGEALAVHGDGHGVVHQVKGHRHLCQVGGRHGVGLHIIGVLFQLAGEHIVFQGGADGGVLVQAPLGARGHHAHRDTVDQVV